MTEPRLQSALDPAPAKAATALLCPTPEPPDASCRWPGTLMLLCALGWLWIACALGSATALRLLFPGGLAGWSGLAYGRLLPATTSAFLYGFAAQASFALGLWITARLRRSRVALPAAAMACALVWNGALVLGIIGILSGDATGNAWLELPRYAALPLMIAGFGLTGLALQPVTGRAISALGVEQWFLLTGMVVFPMLLLAASLLAEMGSLRGVFQAVAATWLGQNLRVFWIDFMGLGVLLYLMPQLTHKPLASHNLAWFSFWTLGLFGALGGMHRHFGGPFPAWMPSLGVMGTVLTLLPLLTLRLLFRVGLWRQKARLSPRTAHLAMRHALLFFFTGGLLEVANSLASVRQITQLTLVQPGIDCLSIAGFATAALLAGTLPALSSFTGGDAEAAPGCKGSLHWLFGGLLLVSVVLISGGIVQGLALADPHQALKVVAGQLRPFLWLAAVGCLLSWLGATLLLHRLRRWFWQIIRERHLPRWRQFCGATSSQPEACP